MEAKDLREAAEEMLRAQQAAKEAAQRFQQLLGGVTVTESESLEPSEAEGRLNYREIVAQMGSRVMTTREIAAELAATGWGQGYSEKRRQRLVGVRLAQHPGWFSREGRRWRVLTPEWFGRQGVVPTDSAEDTVEAFVAQHVLNGGTVEPKKRIHTGTWRSMFGVMEPGQSYTITRIIELLGEAGTMPTGVDVRRHVSDALADHPTKFYREKDGEGREYVGRWMRYP